MFRTQSRGQVIQAELQEGLNHLGAAVTEAGRAAAEQLGPRIDAAFEAAGPVLDAARVAVAPKVAAAVAVAAPAVASAREALTPRVDAARDAAGPVLEAARERVDAAVVALTPRVVAAREAAAPTVSSALTAAGAAAARAAADLAPRVEAASAATRRLASDVAPRVAAARDTIVPALENARGTLVAGVGTALGELQDRRAELVSGTTKAGKKAKRKTARKAVEARRTVTVEQGSRRWPWLLVALAVGAAAFSVLRRRKDPWTPAPAGDGPVPSYREDPVPSSPSNDQSGKTVSDAMFVAGDSAPAESDMGIRDAQNVAGDDNAGATDPTQTAPEPFTSGGGAQEGPTAGPAAGQA
ncbi:hypothetical protein JD79_03981 [Geodermatophilus normandii]|uniref:Uncharacterized protein n=1 Tax=Geodermatophilus normandii TaxID=1137989 RepID=A0A317QST5_9ACTN|nr:hypothetical protein [Geodermatophilus normandii]PWW24790.1 hypothetical protein JD79_03981 [Geodermatophilus normandii]